MAKTSKAVVLEQFKSIDSIKILDTELPEMGPNMLEVMVYYCGVNFADFYTIQQLTDATLPFTLGIECSGVVTNVGSACTDAYDIGDKVICYDYKGGLHREVVRIDNRKCYKIPREMDLQTGAAILVNYVTAWHALFTLGRLARGESVFISSCAGGVGSAAVRLARHRFGDTVSIFGTASVGKRSFVEEMGATFVEYGDLEALDERFNCVVESQSTKVRRALTKKLAPFGRLVIIGAKDMITGDMLATDTDVSVDPLDLIYGNCSVAGLHIGVLAEEHPALVREPLDRIFSAVGKGVTPHVQVYEFSKAREAYTDLMERRNFGKILLTMGHPEYL